MPKIMIDIPETVYDYALGLPDKTTLSSYGVYPVLTDIAYIVKNGTPLEEVLEDIKAEIEQTVKEEENEDKIWSRGLHYSLRIIDKYIGKEQE